MMFSINQFDSYYAADSEKNRGNVTVPAKWKVLLPIILILKFLLVGKLLSILCKSTRKNPNDEPYDYNFDII